jgi:hypothetical protein
MIYPLESRDELGQLWRLTVNSDGSWTSTIVPGDVVPVSATNNITVGDLIKSSMRLLGVIATGETPESAELQDGLDALNAMVDSWSLEKLMIHNVSRNTFPLVAGQASYQMSAGSEFNLFRPNRIERSGIIPSGSTVEYPVDVLTDQRWAEVSDKTRQSIPTDLYVAGEYPALRLYPWPVPDAAHTLVVYAWESIGRFVQTTQLLNLPPGYERALKYALAIELAPEFGKSASPEIVAIANNAKAAIKRNNLQSVELKCDPAILPHHCGYDIWNG